MTRDWSKKKEKYKRDPEFKRKTIERVKRCKEAAKERSHLFVQLEAIRKKIWRRRNSIEIFLERIAKIEKDLIRLTRHRDMLQKRWDVKKKEYKESKSVQRNHSGR